jgi:hypothetical protein
VNAMTLHLKSSRNIAFEEFTKHTTKTDASEVQNQRCCQSL